MTVIPKNPINSSFDFSKIAQLRNDARIDEEGSIKEVSQQFESIFVNMMLQSMRKATEKSGLLDSHATETYEQIFDQELSVHLSQKGSFGVADALERQIRLNQERPVVNGTRSIPFDSKDSHQLNSSVDQNFGLSRKIINYELEEARVDTGMDAVE